ncbi:MAG TPA: hypothetical protein VFU41_08395 [Gemmatimonadales bacterium]|nr:hypothetical protein [Gemmatimonadales bacterium]
MSTRRIAGLAVVGVLASWRLGMGQGGGAAGEWQVTPARPTVGDTVWLERFVAAPPGWRVQPAKAERTGEAVVEPLGDPVVRRAAEGWVVRYPVVAWVPALRWVIPPSIVRWGPSGRADTVPRDTAWFRVSSVIPESAVAPRPQPLLPPLRTAPRDPLPAGVALLVTGALLAGALRWRRRAARQVPPPPHVPLEPEVPDARWLVAGEPKAVAVRATHRLRMTLYRAIPEAHPALSTAECLAQVERARPQAPLRELRDVLEQLDHVAFASAHGTDVAALAKMARRLVQDIPS